MKPSMAATAASAVIGVLLSFSAEAAVLCSAGTPHPDGLSTGDMSFEGQSASDCYGLVSVQAGNNDSPSNIWPTGSWTFLAKDETPGTAPAGTGTVNGVTFTLGTAAGTTGQWQLSWEQTQFGQGLGFDLTMDVVAVLKAGNQFASYLFEDLVFTSDPLAGTGTWSIAFDQCNRQGTNCSTPSLSHLSLYYANAESVPNDPGPTPVPEPTSILLLMAAGIAALTLGRKTLSR